MKGIILAAGRGMRLGALTARTPKCLLQVYGRSLLEWQLHAFRENGIMDIGIIRGYRKDSVPTEGLFVFDNDEWDLTNMVYSLLKADLWLSGFDCIVSYADVIYPPSVIRAFMHVHRDIVIPYDTAWASLWRTRFEEPLQDAETFRINQDGYITDIGEQPTTIEEVQGQFMGLLKLTPRGWRNAFSFLKSCSNEERAAMDITTLLRHLIQRGCPIMGAGISEKWFEIDTENDLKLANGYMPNNQ